MKFNKSEKIIISTLLKKQIYKINKKIKNGYGISSREAVERAICIDVLEKINEHI